MLRHGKRTAPGVLQALRQPAAQCAASATESTSFSSAFAAQSLASDFLPRSANLSASRSVLRLAGSDLLTFLQVSLSTCLDN